MWTNRVTWRRALQWNNSFLGKHTPLVGLGVVVGVLAALGNAAFRFMLEWYHKIFFTNYLGFLQTHLSHTKMVTALLPLTGAIIVAPFVVAFRKELKGYGMPRLIMAVYRRWGRISKKSIILNIFIPTLVIGSGGSAGREGPIAGLGGALGSLTSQVFNLSRQQTKLLVAAGAGAAIAAAFGAPIAGMMFAVEIVLLGDFDVDSFPTIAIASGIAVALTQAFYGREITFHLPPFSIRSIWVEMPSYALMGIPIGICSFLFIIMYHKTEEWFNSLKLPLLVKPIIGGALVGLLGVLLPQVYGNGYPFMEEVMTGRVVWTLAAVLVLAKMLGTSLTVGSGNPGGLFAPCLYIGCMLGGSYGGFMGKLMPSLTAPAGAYASVGMGAFLATACHAPLTGIFLLFEMTHNYQIMLPAIFSATVGTILGQRLCPHSLDTYGLAKRGIEIHHGKEKSILESLTVKDALSHNFDRVHESTPLPELKEYFKRFARHTDIFVVDDQDRLVGVLPFRVIKRFVFSDEMPEIIPTAGDLCEKDVVRLSEDDTLLDAIKHFGKKGIDHLPVVSPYGRLIGSISRRDVLDAYNREENRRALEGIEPS